MKKLNLALLIVLVLSFSGQAAFSGQELALGDVYPNTAEGISGVLYNPANLITDEGGSFYLSVGAKADLDSFNLGLLQILNAEWDEQQRQDIVHGVSGSAVSISGHAVPTFGVRIGKFGLIGGGQAQVTGSMPKQFVELAMFGIDGKTLMDGESLHYSLNNLDALGVGYGEGGVSFAYDFSPAGSIDRVQLGVTGKYLYGAAYEQVRSDGDVRLAYENNISSITATDIAVQRLSSRSGTGYAVDFGSKMTMGNLTVDASMLNIGKMTWNNVEESRYYRDGSHKLLEFGFDLDNFALVFESEDFDKFLQEETNSISAMEWQLPRIIRVGLAYEHTQKITLFGEIKRTEYFAPTESVSFLLVGGAELRPFSAVPIRVALRSLDGALSMDGGLGMHVGAMRIDAGIRGLGGLLGYGNGFGVGVNLSFIF